MSTLASDVTPVTQTAVNPNLFNRKSIRNALKAWPSSQALGAHPLAALQVVDERRREAHHAATQAGRGVALRQVLQEVVGRLKPASEQGTPDFTRPSWRYYYILYEQYFRNQRAKDLQGMMGISESGYFTDQRKALDRVGEYLREMEIGAAEMSQHTTAVSPPVSHSLPQPPTPFIGREAERAQMRALLKQDNCRLITIVGPGGMGKTRLAIQVAQEQRDLTAVFVLLDLIEEEAMLVSAVGQAVRFTADSQEHAREQLLRFLRAKQLLIVLDNFEQLVRHCTAFISDLLRCAPDIKLIVTSRERLNLRGEWVVDLQGLDVPLVRSESLDESLSYSAVQLFLEALGRVHPIETELTAAELTAVVEICHLVGGLPLGLELAASWGSMMSCAEIAAEIQQNIDFLATTLRDLPPRHQSLRAVFNHSWVLLNEAEQKAFRQLGVFRGTFSREAAQAVAGASLPILHALASKSLVRLDDHGRYAIHPLLRQFAKEKLQAQLTDAAEVERAHADYYLAKMRRLIPRLKQGGTQPETLMLARRSLGDVRVAWHTAVRTSRWDDLLETVEGMYLFFAMTNRVREGYDFLSLMGDVAGQTAVDDERWGRFKGALCGVQGRFAHVMGLMPRSKQLFGEALALLEEHGRKREIAFVSLLAIQAGLAEPAWQPAQLYERSLAYYKSTQDPWGIANVHLRYVAHLRDVGATDTGGKQRELMQTSLRLRQEIGDRRGVAHCLNYLCAMAYERGDYEEARQYAQQSLHIHRKLNDFLGCAHSLNHLGQVAVVLGQYEEAQSCYRESLALLRQYGSPRDVAICLDCVGYVTYLMADYAQAEPCYQESLEISRDINDPNGVAWSLHNLGDIARMQGRHREAKRLYAESHRLHAEQDAESWGGGVALNKLGRVTLALNQVDEAEAYFQRALRIAMATQRRREALDVVLNLARVAWQRGEGDTAVQWLSVVVRHPATAKETLDQAQMLLDEARLGVADEVLAAGQQLTLAAVAMAILRFGGAA